MCVIYNYFQVHSLNFSHRSEGLGGRFPLAIDCTDVNLTCFSYLKIHALVLKHLVKAKISAEEKRSPFLAWACKSSCNNQRLSTLHACRIPAYFINKTLILFIIKGSFYNACFISYVHRWVVLRLLIYAQ